MRIARFLLLAAMCLLAPIVARAQTIKANVPFPLSITAGGTYQLLIPGGGKLSIEIQNNNTTATDYCYLLIGGPWVAGDTLASTRTVNSVSLTAAKASVLLGPGQSYTRYYPYIPGDQILATCTSTGDSIYAGTQ